MVQETTGGIAVQCGAKSIHLVVDERIHRVQEHRANRGPPTCTFTTKAPAVSPQAASVPPVPAGRFPKRGRNRSAITRLRNQSCNQWEKECFCLARPSARGDHTIE